MLHDQVNYRLRVRTIARIWAVSITYKDYNLKVIVILAPSDLAPSILDRNN